MTLSELENNVPPRILKRGEEYYINDTIKNLKETSAGVWSANVIGSEVYIVHIEIEGDEIVDWQCDCPYDGDICKHVVASLLTIRKEKKEKKNRKKEPITSVVTDSEIVTQVIQEAKKAEGIEQLVSFIAPEELATFVCEYANTHADFDKALRRRFTRTPNPSHLITDYSAEIEKCFSSSRHKSTSYDRYSRYEEAEIDSDEASAKLDVHLNRATFLLSQKSFGDVASIALQVFRSIGEYTDEDPYDDGFDEVYIFCANCEDAAKLLTKLAENEEVPQSLKEKILDELSDIARHETYSDYCYYDIDSLLDKLSASCLTKEEQLKRVEKAISETDRDSYKIGELVRKKIDLLLELSREEEAEKTITAYSDIPDIRKVRVYRLLEEKKYEEALRCIDQGIELANQQAHPGVVLDWIKEKLSIYQLTNNVPFITRTAKEIFIASRGDMESYRILKKHVAPEEWKLYLKALIEQTKFPTSSFLSSSIEADIYVEEKDEEQLMAFIQRTSGSTQLELLRRYAKHLKSKYSTEVLALYTLNLKEHAERNMGRKYYEQVASMLQEMKKFKGGTQVVSELVLLFRTQYRKRTAMMEIIGEI